MADQQERVHDADPNIPPGGGGGGGRGAPNNPPLVQVNAETIVGMPTLKVYSIKNGRAEDIVPYLMTASIPVAFHWRPIVGARPATAVRCIDGYIKTYLYALNASALPDWDTAKKRLGAIMLGVSRAVMTTNYDLVDADIGAQETAAPLLSVAISDAGVVTYSVLPNAEAAHVAHLTANLALTAAETTFANIVMRCAQAIPPLQGVSLVNEGHHYLSDKKNPSTKAFTAVEKQLWVGEAMKDIMTDKDDFLRDIIWHKAGHPIRVDLKMETATSLVVKRNLEEAGLGSATARLPVLEPDIRAAATYLKVAESVRPLWATMGGGIDTTALQARLLAVKSMPLGEEVAAVDLGNGQRAANRREAIEILKGTLSRNSEIIATAYGFYCAMLDDSAAMVAEMGGDTLKKAYSLAKLRSANTASIIAGGELYRDYRAYRASLRTTGELTMPKFTLFA